MSSSVLERLREFLRGLSAPSHGPCGGGDPSVWQRDAEERRRARERRPAPGRVTRNEGDERESGSHDL